MVFTTDKQAEWVSVTEPPVEQVVDHIRRLDNEVHTGIGLRVRHIVLHILGGNEGRVLILALKLPSGSWAKLVDTTYNGEDKIITIHYAREYDDEDIRTTVPKETAVDVASYLWKNSTLPSGLTWEGGDVPM